ncbi:MAG: histidine phosphatase family protein [Anaerolineales bacterium]
MTTLLLIRHAQTDWLGERLAGRTPDVHLNAAGRKRAEEVAAMLRPIALEAVYSSPLERALETAEPTARAAGKRIRIDERLQEVDFGELSGKPYAEFKKQPIWDDIHIRPAEIRFPGGESLQEVQDRSAGILREIGGGRISGAAAIFTHADTIRLALAYFLRIPLAAYHALVVAPASVSVLSFNRKGAVRLIGVNLPPGTPLEGIPG